MLEITPSLARAMLVQVRGGVDGDDGGLLSCEFVVLYILYRKHYVCF